MFRLFRAKSFSPFSPGRFLRKVGSAPSALVLLVILGKNSAASGLRAVPWVVGVVPWVVWGCPSGGCSLGGWGCPMGGWVFIGGLSGVVPWVVWGCPLGGCPLGGWGCPLGGWGPWGVTAFIHLVVPVWIHWVGVPSPLCVFRTRVVGFGVLFAVPPVGCWFPTVFCIGFGILLAWVSVTVRLLRVSGVPSSLCVLKNRSSGIGVLSAVHSGGCCPAAVLVEFSFPSSLLAACRGE